MYAVLSNPWGTLLSRAELYIDRGDDEENRRIFDYLLDRRDQIENEFGGQLEWEPLENRRACRIKAEQSGNVFDRQQWDAMISFMVDRMMRLEAALTKPLQDVNSWLKSQS